MTRKRVATRVWLIEDNEQTRKQYRKIIEKEVKGAKVTTIHSLQWALQLTGRPDVVLVDLAAIDNGAGPTWTGTENYTRQLRTFMDQHPGAAYGIYSLVNCYASDLVKVLSGLAPDAYVEQVDYSVTWTRNRGLDTILMFIEAHMADGVRRQRTGIST